MTTKTPHEVLSDFCAQHVPRPDAEGTAARILSALTAAGYSVEQGWQPIETAPKGMAVLLIDWDGIISVAQWGRGRHGVWAWIGMADDKYAIESQSDFNTDYIEISVPAYWRPLPAPPAEKVSE